MTTKVFYIFMIQSTILNQYSSFSLFSSFLSSGAPFLFLFFSPLSFSLWFLSFLPSLPLARLDQRPGPQLKRGCGKGLGKLGKMGTF